MRAPMAVGLPEVERRARDRLQLAGRDQALAPTGVKRSAKSCSMWSRIVAVALAGEVEVGVVASG